MKRSGAARSQMSRKRVSRMFAPTYVAVGKDFQQGNFERRKRQRAIQAKPAALPLSRDAGMAVKKSCHQISLIAIHIARVFLSREIAQHGLSDFGVRVRREGAAQHGGGNGQVQQAKPTVHPIESPQDIAVSFLQRDSFKTRRNRDFATYTLLQKLLVEALDGCQDSQFPLGIFDQSQPRATNALNSKKIANLVKTKCGCSTRLS